LSEDVDAANDEDEVWSTFCRGPATLAESAGVRAAWHRGRRRYHLWAFRVRAPDVTDRVAHLQQALAGAFEPAPRDDLHVTAFVAGFATTNPLHDDCVPWQALDLQTRALREEGRRVRLRVGGVGSFLSVPFLWVGDPYGELDHLRSVLARHGREIRFAPYRPHLTLGRYVADVPTAPLAARFAPFRQLPSLELNLDAVELVSFEAATPGAPLVTERTVPLK